MRDSRSLRNLAFTALAAAIGAVVADHFIKPMLARKVGVRP